LLAAVLTAFIPVKFLQDLREKSPEKTKSSFLSEIKFGVKYLYANKLLRGIVLTTASIGFCYSISISTIILFITQELALKPAFFGIALSIQALGAILGGLLAPALSKRFGRSQVMAVCIFLSSLFVLLEGFAPNIYIFITLATLGAFTISNWNILLMSMYQNLIPQDLFGRIHGARRTIVWGLMPFGSLMGGFLANAGLRTPLIVGGLVATIISSSSLKFFLSISDNSQAQQ